MYNDSNYSDSYHLGDQQGSYQQQSQHKTKHLKIRLLLILMALMKVGFYLYRISIRISLGGTEVSTSAGGGSLSRASLAIRDTISILSALNSSSQSVSAAAATAATTVSSLTSHLSNLSLLDRHILEPPSQISVSIAILFAFAISVELFGMLAVAACSCLASLVYLLLICIQTTISWIYPADPNKTLVILAHLVDLVLLAVLLVKLNQCGTDGGSGSGGGGDGDQQDGDNFSRKSVKIHTKKDEDAEPVEV